MDTVVSTSVIVLECIDGKDDFLKLEIESGRRLVLGNAAAEGGTIIKELEQEGGCVIVTNNNGNLIIDATECTQPVKINGQLVTQNSLRENDVLRIGNSIWKMYQPN